MCRVIVADLVKVYMLHIWNNLQWFFFSDCNTEDMTLNTSTNHARKHIYTCMCTLQSLDPSVDFKVDDL